MSMLSKIQVCCIQTTHFLATLSSPNDIKYHHSGVLYIAESSAYKVSAFNMSDKTISLVAGTPGLAGFVNSFY
jgi:hypothetical protein